MLPAFFPLEKVHKNRLLHFKFQYHLFSQVHIEISLKFGIFHFVPICEVFRVTSTLFDGDLLRHMKNYTLKNSSFYCILNGLSSCNNFTLSIQTGS